MKRGDLVRIHHSAVYEQPVGGLVGLVVDIYTIHQETANSNVPYAVCDVLVGRDTYPVLVEELELISSPDDDLVQKQHPSDPDLIWEMWGDQ